MRDRRRSKPDHTPVTSVAAHVRAAALLAAALVAGCSWDAPPVEWDAPTPLATAVDSSARYTARLAAPGATPAVVVERAGPGRRWRRRAGRSRVRGRW